jgi:hypothetical protein
VAAVAVVEMTALSLSLGNRSVSNMLVGLDLKFASIVGIFDFC